jgi:hypothetical protein
MQVHQHSGAHWQPWARGIAIVLALIAAPIVLARTWLAVVRGLF